MNEGSDDDAKIEITDLDTTFHNRTLHELHFSPRARLWMIVVTIVSIILFLTFTVGSQVYTLLYKPKPPKIAINASPSAIALQGVMNGIVYAADPDRMFYAIHANNGSLIWRSFYPNISQSISSNGIIYTCTPSGMISATRSTSNTLLWKYQLPVSYVLPLVMAGNQLYAKDSKGTIYALNVASGTLLWQYQLHVNVAQPVLAVGSFVFINDSNGILYTLRASDGKLVWRRQLPITSQVLATDQSIIYASEGNVTVLHASDGSPVWHLHFPSTPVQPLAMARGNIYVATFDNNVTAFHADDGTLLWRHRLPALAYEALVASDSIIYIHASNSAIYTLNAVDGTLLWSTAAKNVFTFVVMQGTAYVVTVNNDVEAFDSNGTRLWQRRLSATFIQPMIVASGVIYMGTSSGTVYALRASDSTVLWRYATQVQS